MDRIVTKREKAGVLGLLAPLLSLLLFAAVPVEATRTLPSLADSLRTRASLELSLRPEADAGAAKKLFRLFDEADLPFPPRVLELEGLGRSRSCNYDFFNFGYEEGTHFVAESRHFDLRLTGPGADAGRTFPGTRVALFQGAWTDPITGIAYHRNRWYDPRTASWLSEDPAGAVDYSFDLSRDQADQILAQQAIVEQAIADAKEIGSTVEAVQDEEPGVRLR